MRLGTKLLLSLLGAVLLVVLLYQGYILVRYRLYDGYKQYITEREDDYEEGKPFKSLAGGGNVPGFELVCENDILQLYVEPATTNTALYDKRNGKITYSCPPDADNDPNAVGLNASVLKSHLSIEYFNARRVPGRYNSYDLAVKSGQFEIESLENGLRVIYTIGDLTVTTGIVPVYIHQDRLQSFLDLIESDKDRNEISMRYTESSSAPEGFLELREGARGAAVIRRMTAILEAVGYTEDDLLADSLASGMEDAVKISFDVPLEYRLDGDSLVVSVPTSHIVERGGAKIDKIHVLRFFGAAGMDESGYFVVPNGSGSLINFNNGKTNAEDYSQYVYGLDPLGADYTVLGNAEMVRLPVFGIQKEGYGILAQIEDGQTFSQIIAGVSGKTSSYNSIYSNFIVRGSISLLMFGLTGNEAEMPVVERDIYNCNLTVRYSFLTSEYDGYSGMARYYREVLESKGALPEAAPQGDIPLYMDMIGSVTGTKFALSIQYQGIIPMTTYKQAGEIVDLFSAAGISNQVVNFQGWFNRGYYHDVPDQINLVRQLGNKSQLEELSAKLEAQGGRFYADVLFQEVPFSSKRFNYPLETSRFYGGGMVAARAQLDPLDYQQNSSFGYIETAYDLLSPKFLPRYVDAFINRFQKYNVMGISLRDLGSTLHSDRKRTEFIDREQALDIVSAQLDKLAATGKSIMASGGNLYSFAAANDLINIPTMHNDFYIVDVEIPFYEMIIHGSIPYAGYALNLSDADDQETAVLKMLEFGASPHFTFSYEEASEMKYTGLNRKFNTYYANWTNTAIDIYNTLNPVLSKVNGSTMLLHEITEDGLRCVTYDNGVQIIVNYSGTDLTYQGVTVPAMGFAYREGVTA